MQVQRVLLQLLLVAVALFAVSAEAKLREGECGGTPFVFFVARGAFIHALSCVLVCIGTLTKVANEIPVDNKTPAGAEKSLKDYCKTAVNKENRFVTSHVAQYTR